MVPISRLSILMHWSLLVYHVVFTHPRAIYARFDLYNLHDHDGDSTESLEKLAH